MTDAPLRANPEDRPLPPSGGNLPASPSGGALPASPSGGALPASPSGGALPASPSEAASAGNAAKQPTATHLRPIGRPARPPRDWRRAWAGFLVGVLALLVAVGLTWALWDLAGPPRTVQAPAEQLPPIDLAELEALLDNLGFPPGEIDGVVDADTSAAIRDFQATAGLTVDGAPSEALLEELRGAHLELTGGQ